MRRPNCHSRQGCGQTPESASSETDLEQFVDAGEVDKIEKSLIEAGLIQNNKLEEIVWAVRTRYARDLWDRPSTPDECKPVIVSTKDRLRLGRARPQTVVDFVIPPQRK